MLDELLCVLLHVAITTLPIYYYWLICLICAMKAKNEKKYWNWFEVVKFVSVLVGTIAMDFQYDCSIIFRINILEAVVAGLVQKDLLNGILGVYLCVAPLDFQHAVLYSIWNARFSYNGNFSRSTRIILLVPFIAMPWSHNSWLKIRGRSLLLNMALRTSQWCVFYIPGRTTVTH